MRNLFSGWIVIIMIFTAMAGLPAGGCSDSDDTQDPVSTATAPPDPTPAPAVPDYLSAVMHTSLGDITLKLYDEYVPNTVANFVKLSKDGFYDGMIFHRISDDFMIQAGQETADGTVKTSPYGTIDLEIDDRILHTDGSISMARSFSLDSASSQFFICDGPQKHLDEQYAVFGIVMEGIEIVRDIASQPHDNSHPAGGGKPLEDITIDNIEILGEE